MKNPSTNTPQISSTGLFIPYTINKKQQQKKTTAQPMVGPAKTDSDFEDDDDDDNQMDFLGLTKSNQIQVSNNDVESVLRETFPKARSTVVEQQPILPNPVEHFDDLDDYEQPNNRANVQYDDDEVSSFISIVKRPSPRIFF